MNIFAHRGLSAYYPENTMLSFRKCLGLNIYGIELDVQKSKDDHLVVIHDEKVDRTYNAIGFVKDFTLEELQSFNSKSSGFECKDDCKIPTLEEVLKLFKSTNFIINIELKNSKVKYKDLEKDVIRLVKKLKMEKQVILSSFNLKSMILCKKLDHKIDAYYLVDKLTYTLRFKTKVFGKLKRNNISGINPDYILVDSNFVKKAHKKHLKVNAYTVNDINTFKSLKKLKVDGIFTNYANVFADLED